MVPSLVVYAKLGPVSGDRMGNRESCFVLWVSGLPEQKDMKKPCTSRTGIHHLGFQFQKGLG